MIFWTTLEEEASHWHPGSESRDHQEQMPEEGVVCLVHRSTRSQHRWNSERGEDGEKPDQNELQKNWKRWFRNSPDSTLEEQRNRAAAGWRSGWSRESFFCLLKVGGNRRCLLSGINAPGEEGGIDDSGKKGSAGAEVWGWEGWEPVHW